MSDSFHVTYLLTLFPGEEPEERIRALQLEQSVELPDGVVQTLGMQHVTGSVTGMEPIGEMVADTPPEGSHPRTRKVKVTIAWPRENLGNEITQFLNVLFGNISMKRGIAITDIRWEDVSGPGGLLKGPALGIDRIRKNWDIPVRALACTALKPMGCTSIQLADLAHKFALGGVDIIKDDHGLADQASAPFAERVRLCVEAIDRAAQKTGRRSRYFPNITADPHRVAGRYEQAAELGADGVLLIPMLVGPALMHHLARLDTGLPIMAHPAFSGSFVIHDPVYSVAGQVSSRPGPVQNAPPVEPNSPVEANSAAEPNAAHGFEAGLFYGGLMRALGADFTIYPNTGGRFSFIRDVCDAINSHARRPDHPFAPCFPTPGGGMQRDRMAYWLQNYGTDTTFLMGGSLFEDPAGIEAASRAFMETLGT